MERENKYRVNDPEYIELLGICIGMREAITEIQASRKTESLPFPPM